MTNIGIFLFARIFALYLQRKYKKHSVRNLHLPRLNM